MADNFRGMLVRGNQIQDETVTAEIIAPGAISNIHVNQNAQISEFKLDINWHNHPEALIDKKIVNYIQMNDLPAIGTYLNLQSLYPEIGAISRASSYSTTEGIIIDSPKNFVYIVDSATQQPITTTIGSDTYSVLGRISYQNNNYMLNFYTPTSPTETPYSFGASITNIDINYPRRFNLASIDEMLFSGSKFVQGGSVDVDVSMDLQQLAKDMYGPSWSLNHDGTQILTTSLVEQINNEYLRATDAESQMFAAISLSINNMLTDVNNLKTSVAILEDDALTAGSIDYKIQNQVFEVLADVTGATRIGVMPIEGIPTNINTVQGILAYLKANGGSGGTINGNFDRTLSPNEYFGAEQYTQLEERLLDDNNIIDFNLKKIDIRDTIDRMRQASVNGFFMGETKESINKRFIDVENLADEEAKEIHDARGIKASLNERISVSLNPDGTLIDADKLHQHIKFTTQITTPISRINIPVGYYYNINDGGFNVMVNPLQVYVNGILQANGIHFLEIADSIDVTKGIAIDFSPSELVIGDTVTLEWPSKIIIDSNPSTP